MLGERHEVGVVADVAGESMQELQRRMREQRREQRSAHRRQPDAEVQRTHEAEVPVDLGVVDERERPAQPIAVVLEQRGGAGTKPAVVRRLRERVVYDDQLSARLAVLLQPVGVHEVARGILGRGGDRGLERRLALPAIVRLAVDVLAKPAVLALAGLAADEELRFGDAGERVFLARARGAERAARDRDAPLREGDVPELGRRLQPLADHDLLSHEATRYAVDMSDPLAVALAALRDDRRYPALAALL